MTKETFELDFNERKFYARTLEEVFTIVGEQDGSYTIEWLGNE